MDPNKLTIRSQEALAGAQRLASARNQQTMEPEHLLYTLLSQPDGVVFAIVGRLGVAPPVLRDRTEELLERIPRAYGAQQEVRIGPALSRVLEQAFQETEVLGDEYVSVEHLLLALIDSGGAVTKLFEELGVSRDYVLQALVEIRGSQRVTSETPEDTYRALERFGRDLTDLARKGKLDPVIGRDDEIRRVIQVLSRCTKNNPVLIGAPRATP